MLFIFLALYENYSLCVLRPVLFRYNLDCWLFLVQSGTKYCVHVSECLLTKIDGDERDLAR